MFDNIESAIDAFRKGGIIVVCDDDKRENEADLVFAAEFASKEHIAFLADQGRGLICMPIAKKIADELELKPMVAAKDNNSKFHTAFMVSIGAKHDITTGISAGDRAKTVLAAISGKKDNIVSPGHIFPLLAKEGGVLERPGHTEASVDLAIIAGLKPAAVLCEIMMPNGEMARGKQVFDLAKKYGLPVITVGQIIEYRRR